MMQRMKFSSNWQFSLSSDFKFLYFFITSSKFEQIRQLTAIDMQLLYTVQGLQRLSSRLRESQRPLQHERSKASSMDSRMRCQKSQHLGGIAKRQLHRGGLPPLGLRRCSGPCSYNKLLNPCVVGTPSRPKVAVSSPA